ncbi:MAG: glycosyltransferase [Acidimicrobiales bacterium]
MGQGLDRLACGFCDPARRDHHESLACHVGAEAVDAPEHIADRVIDVGFLSLDDRNSAMAAAAAYVQPSALESFSRTVLEAWLAGTPVIANAGSEVVRWHIERSGAGLAYHSPRELVEALRLVVEQPRSLARLAAGGRPYVVDNYTPSDVLDRAEAALLAWTEVPAS